MQIWWKLFSFRNFHVELLRIDWLPYLTHVSFATAAVAAAAAAVYRCPKMVVGNSHWNCFFIRKIFHMAVSARPLRGMSVCVCVSGAHLWSRLYVIASARPYYEISFFPSLLSFLSSLVRSEAHTRVRAQSNHNYGTSWCVHERTKFHIHSVRFGQKSEEDERSWVAPADLKKRNFGHAIAPYERWAVPGLPLACFSMKKLKQKSNFQRNE